MKKTPIAGLLGLMAAATGLSAQTVVDANITADTVWGGTANPGPIVLEGPIFVTGGAELTILPGTIIRGQPRRGAGEAVGAAPGSLIITQDGMINASGNAANPIIFTTAAVDNDQDGIPDDDDTDGFLDGWTAGDTLYDADPMNMPLGPMAAGDIPGASGGDGAKATNVELWGGLVILGRAPTNLGVTDNATAKVGDIEGLTASALTQYGGNIPNDNSGVLRYVSVRHGGDQLGTANEVNGITLGGVGYGTTFEYCEVYLNWDDGIEWFGGTVNSYNLVVTFAGDDQFDGDQGYTGQNQFWVGVMPYFPVGSENGDEGFEFDGDDSDVNTDLSGVITPFPNYSVYNVTMVGPTGATGNVNAGGGRLLLRNNYSGQIVNGIIVNTGTQEGLEDSTPNPIWLESLTFSDTTAPVLDDGDGTSIANNIVTGYAGLEGEDPAVAGGLDLRPQPALGGAVTAWTDVPFGYIPVTYRGAVDPAAPAGGTWLAGWTSLSKRGILVD